MDSGRFIIRLSILFVLLFAAVSATAAGGKLLRGTRVPVEPVEGENKVRHQCLTPHPEGLLGKFLERDKPWSLPNKALAADFYDTIHVLVMRYNFQYEDVDNPNTTGRGHMNLSPFNEDSILASVGHTIDPPPHNAAYFSSHMEALKRYYEVVSEGKITLTWDVFPPQSDSVYQLPHEMSYYGKCDFSEVIAGLEDYFRDCIRVADATSPEIVFADYESIFLFHAGSDAQNDIGFPPTCNDLFTGYINYVTEDDTVYVDNDSTFVTNALLMPETASQDNRATALNAVIAHEFGHQLGLVDLYSTQTFMSQLGDFALMDNNGFGTGIDFGFQVGNVFGAVPIFPMAWSRAHLGFVDVVDFRQGTDIQVVAAEVASSGIKVARVPISDKEYYLIENRLDVINEYINGAQQDTLTNVILGPAYCVVCDTNQNGNITDIIPSSAYDFLMPGAGLVIYHVDERVAGLDYNYDGDNNFDDNQLQWYWDSFGNPVQRFITLVEGDGFINFGGFYRSGYGRAEDMYRDDRNTAFTPNTNPQSIDNTGNITHIYIDSISRVLDTTVPKPYFMDSLIRFDVETNNLVAGFPVRAGLPSFHISPIADDLDGDGEPELIYVSGDVLSAIRTNGESFLQYYDPCGCSPYIDSSFASIHPGREHIVPLYAKLFSDAFTVPATGNFIDDGEANKLVAVGIEGEIAMFRLNDINDDGQADIALAPSSPNYFRTVGNPIVISFGDTLFALTDSGVVMRKDSLNSPPDTLVTFKNEEYLGMCRYEDGVAIIAGDSIETKLYFTNGVMADSLFLGQRYSLGPIAVDLDLDGVNEIVVGSTEGDILLLNINPLLANNNISVKNNLESGYSFTVNPIASDVDLDGYPDLIFGGTNALYAFNHLLTLKTSYPKEINSKYPSDFVKNAPIAADIEDGDMPELVFPSEIGNIYSFGEELTHNFPISGGEQGIGSSVFVNDSLGGKLGYLGLDGWFYLWHVDEDRTTNFWPMAGADPSNSLNFDTSILPSIRTYSDLFPEKRFFNYPNPVTNGSTTIRYFLGEDARSVKMTLYDLSGKEVSSLDGSTTGLVDNEINFDCSGLTPGVYRCMIEVEFNSSTEKAFTDISVIR